MRHPVALIPAAAVLGSVLLSACGGGSSGPTPPPAPPPAPPAVSTVSLNLTAVTLVPQQTQALAATVKDGAGNVLTGRTVTWSSDHETVATVSGSGVVTAAGLGTATITATSETKTGMAQITVANGAVVGSTGGTVTLPNDAIKIEVPAGALPGNITITATPLAQPRQAPPASYQTIGPMYALGPSGTTFSQPVKVTFKYDPAKLPRWLMTGDLAVLHLSNSQWSTLTDVAVDTANKTVSGKTLSFSDAGIAANDPTLILTPESGSVNPTHQSVAFSVALKPEGKGMAHPVASGGAAALKYRWKTSGQHGGLSNQSADWGNSTEAQYTATDPQLSQRSGKIDDVTVEVLLNPEVIGHPDLGTERTVSFTANIDADLKLTYDITPLEPRVQAGAAQALHLLITNKEGQEQPINSNYKVEWKTDGNFGTLTPAGGTAPINATYQAKAASEFTTPPPRFDAIDIFLKEHIHRVVRLTTPGLFGFEGSDSSVQDFDLDRAKAHRLLEVKVDYKATLDPKTNKIPQGGTVNLTVTLTPAYNGSGLQYRYTLTGNRGTINVPDGTLIPNKNVRYTGKSDGSGTGTDKVKVEIVSVVAGVELEVVATGEATIEIDDWRSGSFTVAQSPTPGGAFLAAQISIPKVTGATQYQVEVEDKNGAIVFTKTFGGASSTDPHSIGQVLDGGGAWLINLEGGFNTTQDGINGRRVAYQTKYANVKVRYKTTP